MSKFFGLTRKALMPLAAAAGSLKTSYSDSPSQSKIHPKDIKWKYFYWDQENESIKCSTEEAKIPPLGIREDGSPIERNKVAILTTSLYWGTADEVPKTMQTLVSKALFHRKRPSEFCVALPYKELVQSRTTATTNSSTSDFSDIVACEVSPTANIGFLTATTSAAQQVSAITKGFHIYSLTGGETAGQKSELVRDYFRENPLEENHPRRIIAGSSDNSVNQFGLKEVAEYVHSKNAGQIFSNPAQDPSKIAEMIQIFEAREDFPISRKINCEDQASYDEVKIRYQDALKSKEPIKFVTCFPRQLILAIDSPFCPDFSSEKIILGLEGYAQMEDGYNVHDALYRALARGVIKPEQIIAVVIENILPLEEEAVVRRFNGHIVPRGSLTGAEELKILKINEDSALKQADDIIDAHIVRSNAAYDSEAVRVREVAREFGIPVIFGGEVRSGHAENFVVQPSCVDSLDFQGGGVIEVHSKIRYSEPTIAIPEKVSARNIVPVNWSRGFGSPLVEEDSVVYADKKVTENFAYSKSVTAPQASDPELNQKIAALKLQPMNPAAETFLAKISDSNSEIIAGNAGNISERNLSELNGKGLLCIMPQRLPGKSMGSRSDINKLLNSGRLGASDIILQDADYNIPFVILAAEKPEICEISLNAAIAGQNPKTPIFVTTNFFENLQGLPNLFNAEVNLARMVAPVTAPEVTSSSGLVDSKQAGVGARK